MLTFEDNSSLPAPAVALLRVLSVLDGTSISHNLLLTGAKHVKLANYPQDNKAYNEALEVLVKSLPIEGEYKHQVIKIPNSTQIAVRDELKTKSQLLGETINAAVILIAEVLSFLDHTSLYGTDRLHLVRDQVPHINVLRSVLDLLPLGQNKFSQWVPDTRFSTLLNEVAW